MMFIDDDDDDGDDAGDYGDEHDENDDDENIVVMNGKMVMIVVNGYVEDENSWKNGDFQYDKGENVEEK